MTNDYFAALLSLTPGCPLAAHVWFAVIDANLLLDAEATANEARR